MNKVYTYPRYRNARKAARVFAALKRTNNFTPTVLHRYNFDTKYFEYLVTDREFVDGWDYDPFDQVRPLINYSNKPLGN